MNINETVKGIFIKLAKKLGLELSEKSKNDIDFTANGLNPTAIGSGVVANIAVDDSDIIIDGTNARAEAIRGIKDYYTDELQTAVAEVSLGTGDCIVRPYTDGKYIGLNIIGNNNFVITESIGTHIKGVIMLLDEYTTDNKTYRLFESQTLKDDNENTVVYICRFAYKDGSETDILKTHWENLVTEEVITADQLLLGRYKCPTINRDNYNSANGVPITFGCEGIIDNIKTKYTQYNEELTADIAELESKPTTFQNCERLSVLYALQDRLQKSAEQSHIMSYSCVTELQESVEPLTENNILPSYSAYVDTKRQYQQGEISKEKVLKNLEILSEELKNFIKRLYRNTDMPEERNIINKIINDINVGNI